MKGIPNPPGHKRATMRPSSIRLNRLIFIPRRSSAGFLGIVFGHQPYESKESVPAFFGISFGIYPLIMGFYDFIIIEEFLRLYIWY